MPRLTIWHLLVWTACSAALASRRENASQIGTWVLYDTVNGGVLMVAAIVLYRCVRDRLWKRTEPRHWFALVGTWEIVDMMTVTPLCVWLLPNHEGYVYSIAFLGMAAIYLAGTVVGRWQWYWRLAVALHGLDGLAAAAWRLSQELWGWPGISELTRNNIQPAIGVAAVLTTLASVGVDLYRKQYRDWLHWCGITWFVLKWYGLIRTYVIPYLFPST